MTSGPGQRGLSPSFRILPQPAGSRLFYQGVEKDLLTPYRIDGVHLLSPRLVKRFDDFDIDGLRTDTAGDLFVARILKGTIAVLSPQGKLKREIPLNAKEPTNLAFGGPDGKTVFVTQRKGGFVESFRTDRPGREACLRACTERK